MRRPRRPAQDLRFAIDCLPERTRAAMLDGVESSAIIVGAYTDRDGGVCPMLAAHRRGGRTNLASFARAWDRYTHAGGRARRATERELLTLTSMLKASLVSDDRVRDRLAAAVADLESARARREADDATTQAARPELAPVDRDDRRDTGERDRSDELRRRPGWAWLRIFRRYDDYEDALKRVRRAEREAERRELERRELERV